MEQQVRAGKAVRMRYQGGAQSIFLTSDGQERQQPVYTNTSVKMPFTVYDSLLDLFGGGLDQ